MAGLPGNVAWLGAGKQTAKGTPATAGVVLSGLAGSGRLAPTTDTDQLAETDARRDAGVTYAKLISVGGSPEFYARDTSIDFWLAAVLGSVVDSGTTNFSHVITPTIALPYLTVWGMVGNALWEKGTDLQVSELVIRADTGGPLTVSPTLMGLGITRLTADPSSTAFPSMQIESGPVYNMNDSVGAITIGGTVSAAISSFELTISNNLNLQQTNSITPHDLSAGRLDVSLAFDMGFEDLTEYNKYAYGSAAGTTPQAAIFTQAMAFTFAHGTNNSIAFNFPSVSYEEFPVEVQPDGSPIVVSVRARAERNAGSMMTATVKNQRATSF